MAKSPRKGASAGTKAGVSRKSNPTLQKPPRLGGKNLSGYNFARNKNRRLSLAESSSSSSDTAVRANDSSDSGSESSLTAMSEQDETAASRKGSVFFNEADLTDLQKQGPKKGAKYNKSTNRINSKSNRPSKSTKASKSGKSTRKAISGKALYYSALQSSSEDEDSGDDVAVESDDESPNHLEGLGPYSMYEAVDSDESSNESNDDSQNEAHSSSSDDSEVDFVRLQAERRMKNLKAIKGLPQTQKKGNVSDGKNRRRSSLYRRRSEVAIPEDINFRFEFEDGAESAVEKHSDSNDDVPVVEEEDLGEEVLNSDTGNTMEFHFDQPLIEVPKIKDEDLVSDDEYDFDDNALLATLQADNDMEEFITGTAEESVPRTRQGSLSSMNDDFEDPFLREEEKYLVNEFETNGFDDEDDNSRMETARVMDSFNELDPRNQQVLQYASSSEATPKELDDSVHADAYNGDDDEDDEDVDDFIDFIEFDVPLFDDEFDDEKLSESIAKETKGPRKQTKAQFPKKKGNKRKALDSDEEDNSYLWNYFFSSDAESSSESEAEYHDADEQLVLEELFRQNLEDRQRELERESSMEPAESDHDVGYDSGESTDVDMSLPSSAAGNNMGSKSAKEVLSSKTADYRPPVLGTWVAYDSKPFGIIDGLSTRTLSNQPHTKNPRTKNWRGFSLKNHSDDSPIELEELLNVSELDNDDENDVRIWRDFNNNKKHVPLGAFRNKTHMNQPIVSEPMSGYNVSKMNTNYNAKRRHSNSQVKAKLANRKAQASPPGEKASLSKDLNLPSKQKLRRASIADAVSGGYRPTKNGLFSENVLADVEEVLGEDRDFMALIKGL